jgi:6-phosphogluconolactonase/glucosamine-6-phosphate isomerase/deaminase
MRVLVGKDDNEWTQLVWTWFHEQLKPRDRVFMPAGGTALPFYKMASRKPDSLLKNLKYLQLDEILTGPMRGNFQKFFRENMFPFIPQFEWIQDPPNPEPRADAAVLGVGINGHVAFHEPGQPRDFFAGRVQLNPETMDYLNLKDRTSAVTYGAAAFENCPKILLLARGKKKRSILEKARKEGNLPVSWIMSHANVTLISDFNFEIK